ncbi:MAG: hypothetical protein IJE15_03450 [Bacteroidaceae bacterium]|nr:hypothetical protein [Bacteroidaceae bacterium]
MKAKYITPGMEIEEISIENMIATSGVTSDGIGYGGVDEDGSLTPSSRGRRGTWGNLWNGEG